MADQINVSADDRAVVPQKAQSSRWGRRLLTMLVATAAVGGFAVVVVYSYDKGQMAKNSGIVPTITAQSGPTKMRPKDPGGMEVPNRDKQVYGRLNVSERPPKVERLLPPPEPVVSRPPPPETPPADRASSGKTMEQAAKALADIEPAAGNPSAPMVPAPPAAAKPVLKAAEPAQIAAPKPMETAKLSTPPKKAVEFPASSYRIQLASVRSEKAAIRAWGQHKFNHAELFGKLESKIVRVDLKGKGTFYRLQAGPFANEAAAREACSQAKKKKIGCILVRP